MRVGTRKRDLTGLNVCAFFAKTWLECDIGLIRQKGTGNAFVWLCESQNNEVFSA